MLSRTQAGPEEQLRKSRKKFHQTTYKPFTGPLYFKRDGNPLNGKARFVELNIAFARGSAPGANFFKSIA